MPRPILTQKLAFDAATDAGNRAMRRGGRTAWSASDYRAACKEFIRLWPHDNEPPPRIESDSQAYAKNEVKKMLQASIAE